MRLKKISVRHCTRGKTDDDTIIVSAHSRAEAIQMVKLSQPDRVIIGTRVLKK